MAQEDMDARKEQALELRATTELTVKEIAQKVDMKPESVKRLLRKGREQLNMVKIAETDVVKIGSTGLQHRSGLGAQFHQVVSDLMSQGDGLYSAMHGALAMAGKNDGTKLSTFQKVPAYPIPPVFPGETCKSLYPLGGCKVMSTVIAMLASEYTAEAKYNIRSFLSKSIGICNDLKMDNAKDSVLEGEYAKAKKMVLSDPDCGICLIVSLTDINAQKHPLEVGDSHDLHFSHAFNMIITMGGEGDVEVLVYSCFKDFDIKEWIRQGCAFVSNPADFIATMSLIEHATEWDSDTDANFHKLFKLRLPKLVKKKWFVETHVRVLRTVFRSSDLAESAQLFRKEKWVSLF